MLPSAVLTHLKAGVRTAVRPEPDRLMRASRIGDTAEASEAIADDGAGGIEAAPGQLFHLLAPEAVDPFRLVLIDARR